MGGIVVREARVREQHHQRSSWSDKMKKNLRVLLGVVIAVLFIITYTAISFRVLWVDSAQKEILVDVEPTLDVKKQLIPRILHQTYINESIPEKWKGARDSCLNLHPETDGSII
jgi:mannosyltransferase OCH1-like enzyme